MRIRAIAPSPTGVEIAAIVSLGGGASEFFTLPIVQNFPHTCDAWPILFHGADRYSNPLWQVVTFQRTDNDSAFQQTSENLVAIAHVHENKIRDAWNKLKPHRLELFLQIRTTFVRDAFGFAPMFVVRETR